MLGFVTRILYALNNMVQRFTIDGGSGTEKNHCIIDLVVANADHAWNLGFLRSNERVTVGLTRARLYIYQKQFQSARLSSCEFLSLFLKIRKLIALSPGS